MNKTQQTNTVVKNGDDLQNDFQALPFDKKVHYFTAMREIMKAAFDVEYKTHEDRSTYLKNAYQNLLAK